MAEGTEPDLVLMEMGPDTGGNQASARIRSDLGIPVVLISTASGAQSAAAFGQVMWPTDPLELKGAIETALHRHRMEEELRRSQRLFRKVFSDQDAIGLALIGPDRRFLSANPRLCCMLG